MSARTAVNDRMSANTTTTLREGLSVQLVDLAHFATGHTEGLLPMGLSLSMILCGRVGLTLRGQPYESGLDERKSRAVLATSWEDIDFARTPHKGTRLLHVGVMASPEWLAESGLSGQAERIARCGRELGMRGWHPSARLQHIALRILGQRSGGSGLDRLRLESDTLDLLVEGIAACEGPAATHVTSRLGRTMQAVRERIELDPAETISIASLAREFGMGPDTLQRGFKAVFGISILAHLRTYRLDLARRLIEDGAPVSIAAYTVGYMCPGILHGVQKEIQCLPDIMGDAAARRRHLEAFSRGFWRPCSAVLSAPVNVLSCRKPPIKTVIRTISNAAISPFAEVSDDLEKERSPRLLVHTCCPGSWVTRPSPDA